MSDKAEVGEVHDFLIAKLDGRFMRFPSMESIPDSVEEGPYSLNVVQEMPKLAIGELYGKLIAGGAKNFKTKEIAIESFAYQAAKLPEFGDPSTAPSPTAPGSAKKVDRAKRSSTIELLMPKNSAEVLKALAPQARELVLILTELAKEKVSPVLTSAEIEAKLQQRDSIERLNTRQDPIRIWTYYKGTLVSRDLIREK